MSAQSIDWDVVDLIARKRKECHDGKRHGGQKPVEGQDKMNMDRTGAAAEVAFANRYDLPAPETNLVAGDDGYDFKVSWGDESTRVEVKASEYRNPNLMVPSNRDIQAPDIYVLYSAKYWSYVRPIGWIKTSAFLERSERRDSKFAEYCEYLDASELKELPDNTTITPLNNED